MALSMNTKRLTISVPVLPVQRGPALSLVRRGSKGTLPTMLETRLLTLRLARKVVQ